MIKCHFHHYTDVIMTTMASQITSLTVVYSTVYSDADQRKHQSSASLVFVWGIHRDRWIPRTKGQLRGRCFHLMTSSWSLPWEEVIKTFPWKRGCWRHFAITVETLYNTINFWWSTHKRHSIARPKGRGMGCLLWVQRATYCVDLSKLSSIKYLLW